MECTFFLAGLLLADVWLVGGVQFWVGILWANACTATICLTLGSVGKAYWRHNCEGLLWEGL